jgi:hypothetical protein
MTYDFEKANASAFFAVSEVARLLRNAINTERNFEVEVKQVPEGEAEERKDKTIEVHVRIS